MCKNFLMAISIFILLLLLCGCESSTDSESDNQNENPVALQNYMAFGGYFAGGINIIKYDGTGHQVLFPGDSVSSPVWSPDRTKIVFIKVRPSVLGDLLIVVDTVTKVPDTIVSNVNWLVLGSSPWSPDGSQIVFAGYGSGPLSVYVVDATGGAATEILSNASYPSFISNDTIVCQTVDSGSPDGPTVIAKISSTGTGLDTLTDTPSGRYYRPTISNDRTKIAYIYWSYSSPYPHELWTMNPDGSGKTQIIAGNTITTIVKALDFNYNGTKLLAIPDWDDLSAILVATISPNALDTILSQNTLDWGEGIAAWSQENNSIVFSTSDRGIGFMNEDGSEFNKLADSGMSVDW